MSKELLVNGEAMNASLEGMLVVEQFLVENYLFRRNILSGKTEFATQKDGNQTSDYRPLTQEALNSIILRANRLEISEGNPKSDIVEYIHSEEVPSFNPIEEFLSSLPVWDRYFSSSHNCRSIENFGMNLWLQFLLGLPCIMAMGLFCSW